jgi:hypothetical protein
MPSDLPVPSIADLLEAGRAALLPRDETADVHSGAIYDLWNGVGAILFHRTATRDRDVFRAVYFDSAEGDELDAILEDRRGAARIAARAGTGEAYLARSNTAAGEGRFYEGTRISVLPAGAGAPRIYRVSADKSVAASDTTALVQVTSEIEGTVVSIDTNVTPYRLLKLEDQVWDSSWRVTYVRCGEGKDRENDPTARARVRQSRLDARPGYVRSITDACVRAGAGQVALFASDFLGTNKNTGIETVGTLDADGYGDVGLNWCFVGDDGFTANDALITRCRLAMDGAAVCGTNLQVAGMANTRVAVNATVRLWKDRGAFDASALERESVNAVLNYFSTRQNAFYFRGTAIQGAIMRALQGKVQSVTPTSAPGEPVLKSLFNTIPLPRYFVDEGSIRVTLAGPA